MTNGKAPPVPLPTPVSKAYLRLFLGFGVAFGLGLAPYLGLIDVPGFRALVSLYPGSIRDQIIPISAALMGVLAVVVDWTADARPSKRWVARRFRYAVAVCLMGLVALWVLQTYLVVRIPIDGGAETVSFVRGFSRPATCGCDPRLSDADCIVRKLTFDETAIRTCWGDSRIQAAELLLSAAYLAFTAAFGGMIGLLLIARRAKARPRGGRKPAVPRPASAG